jgi:hypothetical protein
MLGHLIEVGPEALVAALLITKGAQVLARKVASGQWRVASSSQAVSSNKVGCSFRRAAALRPSH